MKTNQIESKETATAEEFEISAETVYQTREIVQLFKNDYYDINVIGIKRYGELWVNLQNLKNELKEWIEGDEE